MSKVITSSEMVCNHGGIAGLSSRLSTTRGSFFNSHFLPHNFEGLHHLPSRTESSDTLGFKLCLIHNNHVLPFAPFEIRCVLVEPKASQPCRHVIQQRGIYFIFTFDALSARPNAPRRVRWG